MYRAQILHCLVHVYVCVCVCVHVFAHIYSLSSLFVVFGVGCEKPEKSHNGMFSFG